MPDSVWASGGVLPRYRGHFQEGRSWPKRSVISKRRKFSEEFKREAVGLPRQPGAQLSQVARNIGVGAGVLGRWRRQLEVDKAKAFTGSGVPRDQEVATLKRELARVKKERDFLRDAAAFFAKESF